jgi:dTDP-4-amino-4,6-dideoxygalactose transaminase
MDPILRAAEKHGIHVIEDAAQAFGAWGGLGRPVGTMGHLGCFSFFPGKNLGAFGDGGMVTTNDERLAETVRMMRVHGAKPKYYHRVIGGNFRLDALHAAVLRVKLKYLPAWNEMRRNNAKRYRALCSQMGLTSQVILPEDTPGHSYNQFVVRVPERDQLRAFLQEHGIETHVYYPVPLHLQECFKDLGYHKGDFPYAEAAADDSLALPMYPELTEAQQQYVMGVISEFYER